LRCQEELQLHRSDYLAGETACPTTATEAQM
jgi:hypothetical protein